MEEKKRIEITALLAGTLIFVMWIVFYTIVISLIFVGIDTRLQTGECIKMNEEMLKNCSKDTYSPYLGDLSFLKSNKSVNLTK